MTRRIAAILLTSSSAATAQVTNPGFETGAFSPWVITPTANGTSVSTGIGPYDIDGPGPLPTNQAASFMVGRNATVTTPEGITLSQSITLNAGWDVRISFNWSVYSLVNVYNQSGGIFELLVDGSPFIQQTAPITVPGQHVYGQASVTFHAPESRFYVVALRITRNVPAGEEVVQYVDNITTSPLCYANCDYSSTSPMLNANDFQCFLNSFAAGIAYANCDNSTAPPILNANDFQCFINAFAVGCS